jgi:RNA polymerase sigma-70 factor, ECF subfamily
LTLSVAGWQRQPAGFSMTDERISSPRASNVTAHVIAAAGLRWPDLKVDPEGLTQYLGERKVTEGPPPSIACDLFLAFACLAKVPSAIQLFQATYDPIIVAAAKRFDSSGGLGDELRQRLAESLFVGRGGGRIAEYRGRGPLSAWVRTCAKRAALRLAKINSPEVLLTRDALADEISDVCDQELTLLKDHYGELFRQELVLALNDLPARDRMLLQLHLVAGLSTTRIGKMLQRAAATTFSIIKKRVHARLGVATAELESLLDLARSHIEFTMSSMDELLRDDVAVDDPK